GGTVLGAGLPPGLLLVVVGLGAFVAGLGAAAGGRPVDRDVDRIARERDAGKRRIGDDGLVGGERRLAGNEAVRPGRRDRHACRLQARRGRLDDALAGVV